MARTPLRTLRRTLAGPLAAVAALALAAPGCGPDEDEFSSSELDSTEGIATLEILPLDLWAQTLPADVRELAVKVDGKTIKTGDGDVIRIPLKKRGKVHVSLRAPDHEDLEVELAFDGTAGDRGVSVDRDDDQALAGVSLAHTRGASGKPLHRLYLGLRHQWFSAEGRPARRGNRVDFMMSGEEAYAAVHAQLTQAQRQVLVSTWWWESDFEIVRPEATHASLSIAQRRANTVLGVLEASPAEKRVLVGQLWGQDGVLSGLTIDGDLEKHAARTDDAFELMGQANEVEGRFRFEIPAFRFADRARARIDGADREDFDDEPAIPSTVSPRDVDLTQWPVEVELQHASWHQKFMVVDHEVAFVGGMNLRTVDWDTSAHAVFEPRRMAFDATAEERADVAAKESLPDNGPRKDFMTRIDGPAAQDVADVFAKRWALGREQGGEHAATTTEMPASAEVAPHEGGIQVQVTATMPSPIGENAILESWLNAIGQARDYILIEDQYFRAPILNDALVARMNEIPELKLVVVTKPINEWTDPGCRWTYESAQLFSQSFPDRFQLLSLKAFDTQVVLGFDETDAHFLDIDVHSKLFVVDDRFLSVGSCNKNNRGLIYEGELNLAVLDDAFVTEARRRTLAAMLPPGAPISDDADAWYADLAAAAAANDAVLARWEDEGMDLDLDGAPLPAGYRPSGRVFTMPFGTVDDCFLETVGMDMTSGL